MITRTAVLAVAAIAMVAGYQWVKGQDADIDLGTADTNGWIGMLSLKEGGSNAVVMTPDGSVKEAPGYKENTTVRDFMWRPDGGRIMFSSDREEGAFNLYRWNLADDKVMRRTLGKVGKSDPSFSPYEKDPKNPLFVYGGMVWKLNVASTTATRIVPFADSKEREVKVNSEGESTAGFGQGSDLRIRQARYCGGGDWVAIIRKTDLGEELDVANVGDPKKTNYVVSGERVWMDVDPKSGQILFSVDNFYWRSMADIPKQFVDKDKAQKPFINCVGLFDPQKPTVLGLPIALTSEPNPGFSYVSFSPDGQKVAVVVGLFENGDLVSKALVTMKAGLGGMKEQVLLYPPKGQPPTGSIYAPSWAPNGKSVLFALGAPNNKRDIYSVGTTGEDLKNLTNGKGIFTAPVYSPSTK